MRERCAFVVGPTRRTRERDRDPGGAGRWSRAPGAPVLYRRIVALIARNSRRTRARRGRLEALVAVRSGRCAATRAGESQLAGARLHDADLARHLFDLWSRARVAGVETGSAQRARTKRPHVRTGSEQAALSPGAGGVSSQHR